MISRPYLLLYGMPPLEKLDPRLFKLAGILRQRSGVEVIVEDGRIIAGSIPNCAIFSISEDNKVLVSFHFDAHPVSVYNIVLLCVDTFDGYSMVISNSFLSDVNGVLVYEEEPGFDLAHIHYLRDALADRERKTKVFVA